MKISVRAFSLVSCMATLLAVGTAYADPVATGTVFENATSYPNSLPLTTAGLTPSGTFDVNGFNFNSNNTSTGYTIGGFLTSGGNVVTNPSSSFTAITGDTLNNSVYEFTGYTDLVGGQTYEVTHDDGAILYLNGSLAFNSGSPTVAEASTFSVATTGLYSFDLLYAEVNGPPAVLTADFSLAQTPEPSSFVLLGSGLLAAAGMVRRRMAL
jgi:hypothetical protein